MFDEIHIANICHESNRILCSLLGDHSQPSWEAAPNWQKDSAVAGVRAIKEGRVTKPEQSHESWMKQKEEEGWVYGPVKDAVAKFHPCMVAYCDLPPAQRMKDYLFFNLCVLLLGMEPSDGGIPDPMFRNLLDTVTFAREQQMKGWEESFAQEAKERAEPAVQQVVDIGPGPSLDFGLATNQAISEMPSTDDGPLADDNGDGDCSVCTSPAAKQAAEEAKK